MTNCLQACIAFVLHLPLDSVPHIFANVEPGGSWTNEQWLTLVNWARKKGYRAIYLDWDVKQHRKEWRKLEKSGRYYVGFGYSSAPHAVAMKGRRIVYDPELNGPGIQGGLWGCLVFKRRPRKLRVIGLLLIIYWILRAWLKP